MHRDCKFLWNDIWTLCTGITETEKGCEKLQPIQHSGELTSNMKSLQREVISKMNLFEEWEEQLGVVEGASWVYMLRHVAALYYDSPFSSGLSFNWVSEWGISSVSEEVMEKLCNGWPSSTLAPSLKGSCCHGHCEWKSVKRSGVALQCFHIEHFIFIFLICLLLVCFIIYILYCVSRVNVIHLGLFLS